MIIDDTRRLFFGQIFTASISLLTTIWIARYTGASLFGYCVSFLLVLSVILDFLDFGSCSWAARELAKGEICSLRYRSIMQRKVKICLSLILLAPLFFFFSPSDGKFTFLFLIYPALWLKTNYIQQFLVVRSQVRRAVRLQINERLVWLLYLPLSYYSVDPVMSFILPIILGLLAHGFYGHRAISQEIEIQVASGGKREHCSTQYGFTETKNFGITSVVSDVANLDSVVIANVASLSESGIYSLSARFKVPLLMGAQAFAMKLRPVAAKLNREDIGVLVRENKNFMFSNIALILFGSFCAIFFAERIFGSSYNGLNTVFAISIITAIPNGIILVSSSFLSSIGQEQFIAKVTIVSVMSALAGVAFSATVASSMGAVLFLLIQGTLISIILVRKSTFHYREL